MTHTTRAGLRRGAAVALAVCMATGLSAPAIADEDHDGTTFVVEVAGKAPTARALQTAVPGVDITSVRSLGAGVAAVTVDAADARVAARRLNASPKLSGASVGRRFRITGATAPTSTKDTYFAQQWDLWDAGSTKRAGGYGVDAPRAWRTTTGSANVVVAVLDTGITPHPDLAGARIAPGYDFVSQEDGIDPGDGNGWDDDATDEGDACLDLGETSSWHGTFVTGEIAAQDDRSGVVGQARGVTIEPVRVLGACGGSEADTIAAIEWASGGAVPDVPANTRPAAVISMSLGSTGGPCSAALQAAVDDARSRGSVIVTAAGNDGMAMTSTSPANCSGVISVAATTRAGGLASYSNYGTPQLSPTIAAPGGSPDDPILGDGWTSTTTLLASRNRAVIGTSEGTSMATPRVAAAVALLLSVRPGLGPDEIAARLAATATPFPAIARVSSSDRCTALRCGAGIVNAGDLVGAPKVFVQATRTTVTGTPRVGKRLTAHPGEWRETPQRIRYQWLRDGRSIAGATGSSYAVRAGDAKHRLGVRVSVQRDGTTTASATSASQRIAR